MIICPLSYFVFWVLSFYPFFLKIYLFYFLPVVGVRCCTSAFSGCCEQGLLLVVVGRLLIAVTFLVECRLKVQASVVVAHGL